MKKLCCISTVFLFLILGVYHANGQCTIDSTQTIPGVYPDTIDDAVAFKPYNQDLTFVMILDTMGFTISNYEIANITGLPAGINWVCNNSFNGCNYDPLINLYGCINLSGTALVPGAYIVSVTVIATVAVVGNQNINYQFPFNVVPDTVSNAGFSMTNSSGCAPLTVSFTNNFPGQLAYLWDFNNGVIDTTENPPSQVFPIPGDYIISQTVTPNVPPQFFLTEITVSSVPDNYNELGFLDPDPDLFFVLSDTAGNTVYDSRPATNNTQPPYTWTLPNIQLYNQNYTLQVWDQDSVIISLGDDDLGIINFAGWGSSGTATATVSGASGQLDLAYTIFQLPVLPVTSTDTVHVFASPAIPVVTASGPLTFCEGDSIILTSSSLNNNQWYDSTNVLVGDTNQLLSIISSGYYQVVVTLTNGCSNSSGYTAVTVFPLPVKPTIYAISDTIFCALTGFNLQWYLNGTIINGATGQFYIPLVSGTYSVTASDTNGCSRQSDPLLFQGVGIDENNGNLSFFEITPNPSSGLFTINLETVTNTNFTIGITNMEGRLIFKQSYNKESGHKSIALDLRKEPSGIYLINITGKNIALRKKVILGN